MGELLYKEWMEEEVEDMAKAILHNGIEGVLHEFELWLRRKGYLKEIENG